MEALEDGEPANRDASAPSMESPEIGMMPVHTAFTETGVVVYFGEGPEVATSV